MLPSFTMSGGGSGVRGSAPVPAWAGYLGKSQDPPPPPQTCPWCEVKGQTVTLRTYAINHEETIRLCPSPMCIFPLVSRPLEAVLASLSSSTTPLPEQHPPGQTDPTPEGLELLAPPAKRPRTEQPYVEPCAVEPNGSAVTRTEESSMEVCGVEPNGSTIARTKLPCSVEPENGSAVTRTEEPSMEVCSVDPHGSDDDGGRQDNSILMNEGHHSSRSREDDDGGDDDDDDDDDGGGRQDDGSRTQECVSAEEMDASVCVSSAPEEHDDILTPVEKPALQPSTVARAEELRGVGDLEPSKGSLRGTGDFEPSKTSSTVAVEGMEAMMAKECASARSGSLRGTCDPQPSKPSPMSAGAEECSLRDTADRQPSKGSLRGAGDLHPSEGSPTVAGAEGAKSGESWLDALLLALAQCRTLRQPASDRAGRHQRGRKRKNFGQGEPHVLDLCVRYDSVAALMESDQHEFTEDEVLEEAETRLSELRSSVHQILQEPLLRKSKLLGRVVESPAVVLPVLLDLDDRARQLFQHSVRWESQCQACGCSSSSSSINTVTRYPYLVSDRHPLSAPVQVTCSRCQSNLQQSMLKEWLPPVFAMHFADGLTEDIVTKCSFSSGNVWYSTTIVIQHRRPTNAFVCWCRQRDGSWRAYHDFTDPRGVPHSKLDIPTRDIHLVFWEVVPLISPPKPATRTVSKRLSLSSVRWQREREVPSSLDSQTEEETPSFLRRKTQRGAPRLSLPNQAGARAASSLGRDTGGRVAPSAAASVTVKDVPSSVGARVNDIPLWLGPKAADDVPLSLGATVKDVPSSLGGKTEDDVPSSLGDKTVDDVPSSLGEKTVDDVPSWLGEKTLGDVTLLLGSPTEDNVIVLSDECEVSTVKEVPSSTVSHRQELTSLAVSHRQEVTSSAVSHKEKVTPSSSDPQTAEAPSASLKGSNTQNNCPSASLKGSNTQNNCPSASLKGSNTQNNCPSVQTGDTEDDEVPTSRDQQAKDGESIISTLRRQKSGEGVREETVPSDDLSLSLSYPHEDTFVEALRPSDPDISAMETSAMDTSIGSSTLLDTFEGLSHSDIVTLTMETAQGTARRRTWTAPQDTAPGDRTGEPSVAEEEAPSDALSSPPLVRRSRRLEVKRVRKKDKKKQEDTKESDAQKVEEEGDPEQEQEVGWSPRKQKGTPQKRPRKLSTKPPSPPAAPQQQEPAGRTKLVFIPGQRISISTGAGRDPSGPQSPSSPLPGATVLISVGDKLVPYRAASLQNSNSAGTQNQNQNPSQQPPSPLPPQLLHTLRTGLEPTQPASSKPNIPGLKAPGGQSRPGRLAVVQSPGQPKKTLVQSPGQPKKALVQRKLQFQANKMDAPNASQQRGAAVRKLTLLSSTEATLTVLSPKATKGTLLTPTSPKVTPLSPTASEVILLSPDTPKLTLLAPTAPKVTPLSPTASEVILLSPKAPKVTPLSPTTQKVILLSPTASSSKLLPQTSQVTLLSPTAPKVTQLSPTTSKVTLPFSTSEVTLLSPTSAKVTPLSPTASKVTLLSPTSASSNSLPQTSQGSVLQSPPKFQLCLQATAESPAKSDPVLIKLTPEALGVHKPTVETSTAALHNTLAEPLALQNPAAPTQASQNLPAQSPEMQTHTPTHTTQTHTTEVICIPEESESESETQTLLPPPPSLQTLPVQNPTEQTTMDSLPPDTIITLNLDIEMAPPVDTGHSEVILSSAQQQQQSLQVQEPIEPAPTPSDPKQILQSLEYPTFSENLIPLRPLPKVSPAQTPEVQHLTLTSPAAHVTQLDITATNSSSMDTEIPLNLDTEMDFAEGNEQDEPETEGDLILPSIVNPQTQRQPAAPSPAPIETPTVPPISPAPPPSPASSVASVSPKSKPSPPQPSKRQPPPPTASRAPAERESTKTPPLAPPRVTLQQDRGDAPSVRPHMFSSFKFHQQGAVGASSGSGGSSSGSSSSGQTGSGGLLQDIFVSRQPHIPKPLVLPPLKAAPKPGLVSANAKPSSSGLTGLAALVGGKKVTLGAEPVPPQAPPTTVSEGDEAKSAAMRLKLLRKLKAKKKQLAKLDHMLRQKGLAPQSQSQSHSHSAPPSLLRDSASASGSASFSASADTSPIGSGHFLSPTTPPTPTPAPSLTPSPASSDGTEMLEMLAGGGGGGGGGALGDVLGHGGVPPERPRNNNASAPPPRAPTPAGEFLNIDDFLDGVIFDTRAADRAVDNTDFDSLDMFL